MHARRRIEVRCVTSDEPEPTSIKSCIIAAKLRGSLWLPTSSAPLHTLRLSVATSEAVGIQEPETKGINKSSSIEHRWGANRARIERGATSPA